MAQRGILQAGELQIKGALIRAFALPHFKAGGLDRGEGLGGITHDLGCFFIPDGEAALYQHRGIFLQVGPTGIQHPGKAKKLHGGSVILHRHIGHEGIILGGFCFAGGNNAGDGNALAVGKAGRSSLLGEILQNSPDRRHLQRPDRIPVGVHGMAGEIETCGLLLHIHQFLGGKLRDIRQGDLLYCRGAVLIFRRHGEKVQLTLQILLLLGGHGVHHGLIDLEKLGAV